MTTDEEYPATTNMADDEDAQPVEPQPVEPCGVCGRKFNLSSLSKHERICERTAAKRRKPFDSAKQRIQGTELAEFLPKLRGQTDSSSLGHLGTTSGSLQHSHHHHRHEHHQHSLGRRSSSTGGVSGHRGSSDQGQRTGDAWKQTHDEFLQAIRAARGDNSTVQHQPTSHQQNGAMSNGHHQQPHQPQSSHNGQQHQRPTTLSLQVQTQGVPTRPNEKGQCPTCHRLFGVKSYERHVAFCKERSTRVPASPLLGNNLVAKERLDARMKYRAPGLKNRRPTNREKYSPGNNTLTKTRTLTKEPSGTSSAPDSTARVDNSPKLPILKRQIHSSKESLVGGATNPGPLKSRPMDRSNRLSESQESLNTPALRQLFASRRLLLLSEVLPSKIIKSKTTATVTNSSMKPAVKVVTQFVRKNTSDFNAKVRMKKKIKEREVHDQEDEDDEPIDIAWKERVESGTSESIDKEEEPILSQVSIASDTHKTILHDHDSDNDTVKYESDGDELNRTYELIEGSESLEKELNECIIDVNNDCTNVVYENYRVCTHISEEEEVEKSSDSGKSEACKLGNLPAILGKSFEKSEEPSRKNKTLVKPRKCKSLPNVEEVGMITPRIQEDASPEKVETTSDSKEKRCATYVKEPKPAEDIPAPMKPTASPVIDGEEKWHLHRCERMNHQSSEEVLEFYKNEAASNEFSDVGSVGTVDPPSIEYDTDYVLETDSNASDLIKEIDSSNYDGTSFNTFLNSFSSGSQFDYCVRGANRFEVVRDKRHQGNPRMHARSSGSFLEESSSSTIEAESPRRNKQHYEKEICTITRLDREDEILLPSIGWRSHHEYHREKLVKARPQDYNRQCGTLRRTHDKRSLLRRSFERLPRCDWHSYIRRHPDFSMILRNRIGLGQEYDPFLLAEQQLNDLFSDTSDQSSTDGSSTCPPSKTPNSPTLPQSPSSAFAKYPMTSSPPSSTASSLAPAPQRTSVIDPPRGFDDLTSSDLSSECNSGSREVTPPERHVLGRRLIIDQSQALGGLGEFAPVVSRSNSVRSAPKPPERKTPFILHNNNNNNSNNNNNKFSSNNNVSFKNSLNGSMSSLSSDAATDAMMKRSNSLFDELLSSFEEDCTSSSTLPSLMSLMRNDPSVSLLSSSHNNGHIQNNGRPKNRVQCSDDDADLSSPESLKGKECAPKLSADSAYSSLNRKYSAHGRSANDAAKLKLSRFCHECGFKFPDSAKFCCECGVKRLTI